MTSSITEPHPVPRASTVPRLRPLAEVLTGLVAAIPEPEPAPAGTPPPAPDPRAAAMAERVLRGAVEIIGGRRPAHQLATVVPPFLLAYLAGLHGAIGHQFPRALTVRSQQPVTRVVEAVAVVQLRSGVRAMYARLVQPLRADPDRWRCIVLHLMLAERDHAVRYRRPHPQR